MSMFWDLVESMASGLVSAASEAPAAADDVVTTCCRELGWSIDERISDNAVYLHFNDPVMKIRKVLVAIGEQGTLVSFSVFSAAHLPVEQVPSVVLGYLLQRNGELCASWQMKVRDDGEAAFALNYCVPVAGLQHGMFRMLCQSMVKEAYEFDAKMREAGVLG